MFDASTLRFKMSADRSLAAVYTSAGVLVANVDAGPVHRTRRDVVLSALDSLLSLTVWLPDGPARPALLDPVSRNVSVGSLPETSVFGPVTCPVAGDGVVAELSEAGLWFPTAEVLAAPVPSGFAPVLAAVAAHRLHANS